MITNPEYEADIVEEHDTYSVRKEYDFSKEMNFEKKIT